MTIADRLKALYNNLVVAITQANEFNQYLPDCYDAVEAKGGTIPAQETAANLPTAISSIPSPTPQWTGHIDEVGLRAIGWIDRDIEWISKFIDWNAEDDDLYKVPQELIDAYVAAGNTWTESLSSTNRMNWWFRYRPRGGEGYFASNNNRCQYLLGIPNYETWPFNECRTLGTAAKFPIAINASGNFNVSTAAFWNYSPSTLYFNIGGKATSLYGLCDGNNGIQRIIGVLDVSDITSNNANVLRSTTRLREIWLKGINANYTFSSDVIAKECILYMINNEAASSAITIKLSANAYANYSVDSDIIAALANHPNISLISA